jgi:hypothetical protein
MLPMVCFHCYFLPSHGTSIDSLRYLVRPMSNHSAIGASNASVYNCSDKLAYGL